MRRSPINLTKTPDINKAISDAVRACLNDKYAPNGFASKLPTDMYHEVYNAAMHAVVNFVADHCQNYDKPNQLRMAKVLGINRNTVRTLVRSLKIPVNDYRPYSSHPRFYTVNEINNLLSNNH